jgi:transporter family-2 protein
MPALLWFVLLAVVAGFCLPTQAGINARLALSCHSSILAATISFAVGTLALIAYALLLRIPWGPLTTAALWPWWYWSGGVIGAFFVAATVVLAPKLGAAPMVSLVVAGQMMASLVLDHFGWLGYDLHPMNLWRLAGVLLLVAGVVLIRIS